ncbi:MFS transporter [Martelella alba]|uniref:MFS transporter n=2 Tax=Martelella alba TaxID=2590451 RepID=A0A506UE80_9HYPH|nr:MFS transporter [Martelella alba]
MKHFAMPHFLPPALLFLGNALLYISLFIRMPEIAGAMGIGKAALGVAIFGASIGTLAALPIAGRVTNRLSPRVTAAISLAAMCPLMPIMSVVSYQWFFICFVIFGFVRTLLDVAANMVAMEAERLAGVKVLSRSHGFWSIGLLLGSLFGGFMAGRGVAPFIHLSIISALIVVLAAVELKLLPSLAPQPADEGGKRRIFVLPGKAVLLVCAIVFGLAIAEGTIYDWGIFYIRSVIGADPATAGLLFACFTASMGLMRMLGDQLRGRFSSVRLLQASVVSVFCGIIFLVAVPGVFTGAVALTVIGAGIALNMPLAVAAVAQLPGRSAADNLAAMSLALLISTIGIPPLMGTVAEAFGLTVTFLLLLPMLVVSFLLAPRAYRGF